MSQKSPAAAATPTAPPPSPSSREALDAASTAEAIGNLNRQFFATIVEHWENGHKYHDFSHIMTQYRDFADRLSNDESIVGQSFSSTPYNPELTTVAEEFAGELETLTSTEEWKTTALANNLGFGDRRPSASGASATGKASIAASSEAAKLLNDVTDGVGRYKLESPVKGQ